MDREEVINMGGWNPPAAWHSVSGTDTWTHPNSAEMAP